jgi:hypothetical protein
MKDGDDTHGVERLQAGSLLAADASLADALDTLLDKGVAATGEVTLGLADIDLIHLRLAAVLGAADRLLPPRGESELKKDRRKGRGGGDERPPAAERERPASGTTTAELPSPPLAESFSAPAPQAGATVPARLDDKEEVRRSVARLVLSVVELLRRLMEHQAIRRMEEQTLTEAEIERLGQALQILEETLHDLAARFDLSPDELNLDLGPLGRLV